MRALAGELGQPLGAGPPGARQEPLEHEARRRQPARDERGDDRRRAGHRRDLVAGVERGAHEPLAGVADPGRAGVGDDGDVAAVAEHLEHLADARRLGVLVAHRQAAAATPACCSSRPVRRVSSQQIRVAVGAAPRRRAATGRRGCRSAWRRAPAGRRSATGLGRGASSRSSTTSPIVRPQRSNAPASASITHDASETGQPDAVAGHADRLDDRAVASTYATSSGKRIPIVCTQRHDVSTSAPSRPSRWSRPRGAPAVAATSAEARTWASLTNQATAEAWHAGRRPASRRRPADAGRYSAADTTPTVTDQGVRVPGSILGNRVVRKEDPKFLTSGGRYLDDLNDVAELAGAAHVAYVRSAVAHGTITSIDTAEAAAMPGVLGVFTAADLGLEPVPSPFNPTVARTLLASDRVRYVGEPIAAVVAETREQAADAADAVLVDYDAARGRSSTPRRRSPATTLLYDGAGSNVVFDSTALGMPDLTGDEFFADCEVTVSGPLRQPARRAVPARGARLGRGVDRRPPAPVGLDAARPGHQGPDRRRQRRRGRRRCGSSRPTSAAASAPRSAPTPRRSSSAPSPSALGRPVRWQETRSESMMALGHGRAQVQNVTIGGIRDGTVTHYRLHVIQDSGAFCDMGAILAPFMTRPMSSGVYAIPNIECRTTSVVTNTTPTAAYRGAGRPEATAAIERAMDLFAAEIGMDPAEVRRKNLIAPFAEPHTTAIGQTYDVGDYVGALDRVLEAAGYAELRAEQARRREAGDPVQLGIGVSTYVEITGGVPPMGEAAKIEVLDDGRAVIYTGTSPHGQGHDTSWSMIASDQTGIPIDRIELVWGDTDLVPAGGGTMGSRSLQQGGAAVDKAAVELVDKAKTLAARALEAAESDVALDLEPAPSTSPARRRCRSRGPTWPSWPPPTASR